MFSPVGGRGDCLLDFPTILWKIRHGIACLRQHRLRWSLAVKDLDESLVYASRYEIRPGDRCFDERRVLNLEDSVRETHGANDPSISSHLERAEGTQPNFLTSMTRITYSRGQIVRPERNLEDKRFIWSQIERITDEMNRTQCEIEEIYDNPRLCRREQSQGYDTEGIEEYSQWSKRIESPGPVRMSTPYFDQTTRSDWMERQAYEERHLPSRRVEKLSRQEREREARLLEKERDRNDELARERARDAQRLRHPLHPREPTMVRNYAPSTGFADEQERPTTLERQDLPIPERWD